MRFHGLVPSCALTLSFAARVHRLPQRLDYKLIPPPLGELPQAYLSHVLTSLVIESDLSLPLVTEKAALPAIIVTPSSPKTPRDFSIAFLCPPVKPTFRERVSSYFDPSASPRHSTFAHDGDISLGSSNSIMTNAYDPDLSLTPRSNSRPKPSKVNVNLKARTTIVLVFLFFILVSHVITHRLATRLPHLDFNGPATPDHDELDMTTTTTLWDMEDADVRPSAGSGLSETLSSIWPSFQAFWGVVSNEGKREFVITEEILS